MSFYRTLVPLSYVEGNQVITVKTPGTRIDLTPVQAAALQGQIVVDDTGEFTYPRVDVLNYPYFAVFPDQGLEDPIYFAKDTGLLYRWDPVTLTYVAIGVPTNWDSIDTDSRDDLTTGEATMSRRYITGDWTSPAGTMTFGFFTARRTQNVTQIRTLTGGAAAVGTTLCRLAIFSVDDASNLSLIGSTANDASLWTATYSTYTKDLSSSVALVRGNRYAVGVLQVGGSQAAAFMGGVSVPSSESFISPRLSAGVSGLTDLPSTVLSSSLAPSTLIPYAVVLP